MNKILFLDTVTTGMNPERCAIYRLGGIITENGVETERFDMRIRPFPNARISDQSLWICGETRSSLVRYPDEQQALSFFTDMIGRHVNIKNPNDKAYIAGFNAAAMDVPFLREFFMRNGNLRFRDYFHVQVLDMMTMSAFALMNSRDGMPDFHLETAARYLDINCPYGKNYDCLSNAKTCLDMFRKLETRFGVGECLNTAEIKEITKNY